MARHALFKTATGIVENIVELDAGSTWAPPSGCETRQSNTAQIGGRWDGTQFLPPPAAAGPDLQFDADVKTCRDYLAIGSPTAAQTAAATKAHIRITRRLVSELR